jgi:mannitol-1-/sugar-/sorbitol-6-phosphatase
MTTSGRWPARALLLDMDGTLVDSTDDVEKHWTLWAERRSLDPAAVLVHAHGSPTRQTVARFVDAAEVATETAWVEELSLHTAHERALPGALALLTQRFLPVAVVTSATRAVAPVRLQRAGLPVPAVLVTADDVQRGKPDPAPYLLAAARIGVDAGDCVGVEDTPAGVASLLAAGVSALAVATTFPPADLSGATAVLADLCGLRVEPGAVTWSAH